MNDLDAFAEAYRLKRARDPYLRHIIPGRGMSLIADFGNGRLSVLLIGRSKAGWTTRRRALIAAGCRLEQDGDTEGSMSFEPTNIVACEAAIKAAGCKRRRQPVTPSPAQIAAREEFARRGRMKKDTTKNVAATPRTDDLSPRVHPPAPTRSEASNAVYEALSAFTGLLAETPD